MDHTSPAASASQENASETTNRPENQPPPGVEVAIQVASAEIGDEWVNDEEARLCVVEGDQQPIRLASLDDVGFTSATSEAGEHARHGSSAFIDDFARFDFQLASMKLADPWTHKGREPEYDPIRGGGEGGRHGGGEPGDRNHTPAGLEPNHAGVDENSPGGTVVAQLHTLDQDAGDSHFYEILGGHPLFEIDGNEIRVKTGANLDFETQDGYDLTIRSTDGHGASVTETVHVAIRDVNEAPVATAIADQSAAAGSHVSLPTARHFSDVDHVDHLTYSMTGPDWLSIDPHTGVISGNIPATLGAEDVAIHHGFAAVSGTGLLHLQPNFFESDAGYLNSYGYYIADANGNPIGGGMIETDTHQIGQHDTFIDLGHYPGAASIGFFIVADGGRNFPALTDGAAVTFGQVDGVWKAYAGGTLLDADDKTVLFSDAHLNVGGTDYLADTSTDGSQNWDDQPKGDWDFNDVNVSAVLKSIQLDPAASSEHITVTATDKGGLTAVTSFDLDLTSGNASFASLQEGNDHANLLAGWSGANILSGNAGSDLLTGGQGPDYLVGGAGNDVFLGGAGSDVMIGGDGSDRFVFAGFSAPDTVYGGQGGNWLDIIDLSAVHQASPGHDWMLVLDQGSILSQTAHDITLSADSHGTIQFAGETRIQFHEIEAIHS